MADLLDLPPDREMPVAVRARLRDRVLDRCAADRASRGRTVGAAAVLTAAAVVVLVVGAAALGGGFGADRAPAAGAAASADPGPTSADNGEFLGIPPEQRFAAQVDAAPDGATDRCTAAAGPGAGPAERWRPLLTAGADGVVVVAYAVDAQRVFCELTPATVTLSAAVPEAAADEDARLALLTPLGTAAGVTGPGVGVVALSGDADPPLLDGAAAVGRGVFILPNGLERTDRPGLEARTAAALADFDADAPTTTLPTGPARPAVGPTTDVAQPADDRSADGGQRLDRCLAAADPPVVDPPRWELGADVRTAGGETVQLGRYGELLLTCRLTADGTVVEDGVGVTDPDVALETGGLPTAAEALGASRSLGAAAEVFTDFTLDEDGRSSSSSSVALAGIVDAVEAATVTVSRPLTPPVTAAVVNRTYLLPGIDVDEGTPEARAATTVTVRDGAGTVLETIPLYL